MNKRRSAIAIMAKLITLIKPLLLFMFIAILFGCLGFLCAIFIPVLGTTALLTAIDSVHIIPISNIFVILILIGIFRGVFRYIEQACNHYIAFKLLAVIRDKVFSALRKLSPAKLEGHNKGNLIALITSDIELLEVFYAHTISPIIIAIIISIFMIVFISSFSIYLGVIAAFAYIFIGAIIPIINSKQVADYGISYRNKAGKLNNIFLDSLRGLQELLQYNKTEQRLDEINKLSSSITYDYKKLKSKEIICRNITDTTVIIFNTIILVASIFLYYNNKIEFYSAVICIVALLSSYGPVIALSNLSNSLAQTLASGERVLSLLEEKPVVEEITNGKNIDIYDIKCENLDFSYDDIKILDNINITIPKNSITGILGKSGCGKSTLLKLIMRFWDRDSGKLLLSNTDIKDINTKCLRQNESYCTQDTYLFNDTIGNNIAIAKYNATKDEIIEASKKASLHEFVSQLPMGYDTPIGELGDRLSGGEKQRIGIARAFLSNSNIILLDEPTSNLDSLNESIILKSLYTAKDKTIVLVSHRQSTLNIADTIYKFENQRQS